MRTKRSQSKGQSGFSVIEAALVVVIGGILLTVFSDSLLNMMRDAKIRETETRLNEVNDALKRFASYNNRLPCPANRTLTSGASNAAAPTNAAQNYGIEYASCTGLTDYNGIVRAQGASDTTTTPATDQHIRIGMIPTRTLGLPDQYGYDAWGSRFVYAVTERLTSSADGDYDPSKAAIIINGGGGADAAYAVVSVGPDLEGGFNINGGQPGIDCNSSAGIDSENCDDDGTFVNGVQSLARNANYYDDVIRYQSLVEAAQQFEIPVGAVVAFRLESCPAGWDPLAAAEGRFIMGAGAYDTDDEDPMPSSPEYGYNQEDFTPLEGNVVADDTTTGGWAMRRGTAGVNQYLNLPPYIVYRYCVKN